MRYWDALLGSAALAMIAAPAAADQPMVLLRGLSDDAVFQRGKAIEIGGQTVAGSEVTVDLAGVARRTRTNADGTWNVTLPAREAATGLDLTVSSNGTSTVLRSISVGDVILCSGQSNMEFPMAKTALIDRERDLEIDHSLRLLNVPRASARVPLSQFEKPPVWKKTHGNSADFSAVCMLAGREIARTRKVTVGLIAASYGGTPIEAWMSRDELDRAGGMDEEVAVLDLYRRDPAAAGTAHNARLDELWQNVPAINGKPGRSRVGYANLYNAMLAPLATMPLAGAIWYQGEANAGARDGREDYAGKLATLIAGLRTRHGAGLPVVVVQIAPFGALSPAPREDASAEIREAQRLVSEADPLAELVVTTDVGERFDIHPPLKKPVGERAAAALDRIAGIAGAPAGSPRAVGARRVGKTVQVTVAGGTGDLFTAGGTRPAPIALCRTDRDIACISADASLQDGVISVAVPDDFQPDKVRYCWASAPICNVFDRAQLPLGPFELPVARE
ncbi:sialate O-acetylesterase [Qipengyuania pelagi]